MKTLASIVTTNVVKLYTRSKETRVSASSFQDGPYTGPDTGLSPQQKEPLRMTRTV